ncbi:Aste57867_20980 [Aphanomyces stellatus]|uniref:HECT-type E3 ubiquitin transferase n=1 Tax=Aphanomyces stellatus TaxID=120398 RepID=A0A485LGH3_9STRA|nr:hypothetical protein As57867_020912 [Aphanomyces stellatus]VFT97655.1 Aste57867_20980 [Aphanomyces stellatus]
METEKTVIITAAALFIVMVFLIYGFIRFVLASNPRLGARLDTNFYRGGQLPLLDNDFVGALYGLNRNDVEFLYADVQKWACNVCSFDNIPDTLACALCDTKQGVVVSESEVGPGFLHPTQLNPSQLSARTRKEWVRMVDNTSGHVVWKQLPPFTETGNAYFIVTSTLPTVTEDDLYGPARDRNETIQVSVVGDNDVATEETIERTSDAKDDDTKDQSEALTMRMSLEDEAGAAAISANETEAIKPLQVELMFAPLYMESASRTLMATALPPWLIHQVEELTNEQFSVKYTALLSLLQANFNNYGYSKLKVYREKIFQESVDVLSILGPQHLCTRTRIELLGELGVDAGGLQREWYTLLTQAIFDPAAGLFIATDSYGYTFNPAVATSTEHLKMYRAVGRLLARSILDEQVLPFHFCVPVFKMILGTPLSATDMLFMDHQIHASLSFVSNTKDIESLCLDFSVALPSGDVAELIPNGQATMVTAANQAEYVQRMFQYLLFDRIRPQLESLLTGLFEILPQQWLLAFDHKELELVLCGITEIDVSDWKQFTTTSVSLREDFEHGIKMEWFWDILTHMSGKDRATFLQFATGSSRFKGLTSYDGRLCPFSVKAISYVPGILPRAHACFNRIDLPLYPTKALMEEALLMLVQMDMSEFTIV